MLEEGHLRRHQQVQDKDRELPHRTLLIIEEAAEGAPEEEYPRIHTMHLRRPWQRLPKEEEIKINHRMVGSSLPKQSLGLPRPFMYHGPAIRLLHLLLPLPIRDMDPLHQSFEVVLGLI
jgi:hypothetical protein